ncbi:MULTISPECIES: MFS transporter [Pseudomonas syringae group]|uniref:Membrane protein n=1 Tax=Pseudomonas syringae pv. ribicola TaxID=55398 RepID=A0A0P9ZGU0_PSESI|nr:MULTISPECIES: MFS transporter [Pseudomonas syringae group]EKN43544.1 membrane protein [Pseudomonas viridiflava UASWS0038]KPL62190.1 MFS transporter [Pseudomonas viridiflava]KPY49575.1 Membrane protein [Pseudomonas syringae pv. ribicola]KPZ15797.1 Membrane protein [Pseudomonas viridiflava]MBI6682114.1 MFS transporter [Pseudomonas viridiflava]
MNPESPAASTSVKLSSQPGFISFILSRLMAVFAMQIQAVVVAWQVYDMTREPMALAYVGLAQFIPMLLLLMPAGDLIDRYNRKVILMISWGVQAVCGLILLVFSAMNLQDLRLIYGALMLYGCARAFTGPALQSLLPQIVPREQLASAIATNSVIMRCSTVGGPLIGGYLYWLGGAELTYSVCVAAFIAGILLLARVATPYAGKLVDLSDSAWGRFTAGIAFIRSRPIILGTISLDLFAVLLGGVVALLPIYAHEVLNLGPQGLGMLRASMSLGELATGIYLSVRPLDRNVGMTMFMAVGLFGVANLVFALSTLFWLSCLALLIAGAADMVSVYIRSALVQFSTPDNMRGRVNAVNMLFIGSSNELGEFRAGTSASLIGAIPAAIMGGVCTLGVVGAWMTGFKTLRQVDRFADATPTEVSDSTLAKAH